MKELGRMQAYRQNQRLQNNYQVLVIEFNVQKKKRGLKELI